MAVADSLITGETIAFESRKHWMAPVRASLWAMAMVAGAAAIRWISPSGDGLFGTIGGLLDLVALGLFLTAIGWIVYNVVAWRTAEFAVTNMRVLREEGLASHRSSTTLLSSLSDVKTRVGFVGARLGYGDLEILTQSGAAGVDRFLAITSPLEFRSAVMTQKMAAVGGRSAPATEPIASAVAPVAPVAPAAPVTSSTDAADALGRLADLHDRGAITDEEFAAKKADLLTRM